MSDKDNKSPHASDDEGKVAAQNENLKGEESKGKGKN